jgi:hypothetical protein
MEMSNSERDIYGKEHKRKKRGEKVMTTKEKNEMTEGERETDRRETQIDRQK